MAKLISIATGNWTASSTWAVSDATAFAEGIAFVMSSTTTSYVSSSTFTPGAITIDGIAIRIYSITASTGTITVALDQGGTTVTGTEVTANVTDLPSAGWVLFKFSSVLLLAATAYSVKLKTSVDSEVQVSRATSGTNTNWARQLRTTTTAAPAAGDSMYVMGEVTGQATTTSFTVTMNETATTDYGSGVTSPTEYKDPAVYVSRYGTLTWDTTATTYLKLSGYLAIGSHGTVNIGTTSTPIPAAYTATVEFDCASSATYGLHSLGTLYIQGVPRTSGKNVSWCKLSADANVGASSLTVDADTGWKNGDAIGVAPYNATGRTQCERLTLNGDAGTSTLTITGSTSYFHSGTSPYLAEVVLLTRNVVIKGNSSYYTFVYGLGTVCDIDWASFRYIAQSSTGGVVVSGTTTATATHSVVEDCGYGFYLPFTTATGDSDIVLTNCCVYNSVYGFGFYPHASLGTAPVLSYCVALKASTTNCDGFKIVATNCGVTLEYCRASGTSFGFNLDSQTSGSATMLSNVTATGCVSSLNDQVGFYIYNLNKASFIDCVADGNNTYGFRFGGSPDELWMSGCKAREQASYGLYFGGSVSVSGRIYNCEIKNLTSSTYQDYGVAFAGDGPSGHQLYFDNCTIGGSGNEAHRFSDIYMSSSTGSPYPRTGYVIFRNCTFGSTPTSGTGFDADWRQTWSRDFRLSFARQNSVDGSHITYKRGGIITPDVTTYKTAAPSQKLSPSSSVKKLESAPILVPVNDGSTKTISVWVRKDGDYTGNAPRLMLKADSAVGITSDTVLDTLSVGANTWEQLSGTTATATDNGVFEAYVDCDGTAGAVYVDDATAT